MCWVYYPHCLQAGSSCFPRKAATLLHKTSPFSHGRALKEQQFLLSCVKDGAWTSTSVPWMPNEWRQALESWSKGLMQQRGTGLCTYFCPQYFFLGSWAAHHRAPRSPGSRSGMAESMCPGCCCGSPRVRAVISFSCTGPFWDTAFKPNLSHAVCVFLLFSN